MKKDVFMSLLLGIGIGLILSSGFNMIKYENKNMAWNQERIKLEAKKMGMIDPVEYFDKNDVSKTDNTKKKESKIIIEIPNGYRSEDVSKVLKQNNLISSEEAFLNKIHKGGLENKLRWGRYEFSTNESEEIIINKIIKGDCIKE